MSWISDFDETQQKEIEFCKVYADDFAHGASSHNQMLIIALLARKLEESERCVERRERRIEELTEVLGKRRVG